MLDSSLNKKILSIINASSCFGIAYSGDAEECNKCSVAYQCEIKSAADDEGSIEERIKKAKKASTSTTKPATTTKKSTSTTAGTKKKTNTTKSETKTISGDMPNFKEMSYEELEKLAISNGLQIKDYGNPSINRMRIIMSLKSLYK